MLDIEFMLLTPMVYFWVRLGVGVGIAQVEAQVIVAS